MNVLKRTMIYFNMAKIQKYELQRNHLWYEADITDEQLVEYKKYLNGEIDEPDWVHELDFEFIKDKCGNDDYELELIE